MSSKIDCRECMGTGGIECLSNCKHCAGTGKIDAPVVERQEPLLLGHLYRIAEDQIEIEIVGDPHIKDGMEVFTAPPELAELQATIARLTAENEQIREAYKGYSSKLVVDALNAEIERLKGGQGEAVAFQSSVQPWMLACFGAEISTDRQERNHRFLEEALELVQACGATESEAHQLVDYVYGREIGDPVQEVGGVMVTLAALCLAHGMDMHAAGETELARIWTKVEQIRAKQAAKPAMSPLPGAYPERSKPAPVSVVLPPYMPGDTEDSDVLTDCRNEGWNACLDKLKELNQ